MVSKQKRQPKKSSKNSTGKKPLAGRVKQLSSGIDNRRKEFLSRRPHRSFKLSRKRDYKRSLKLPGYAVLTKQVFGVIFSNKRIFLGLAFLYAVLTLLFATMMSQDTYTQIREVVDETAESGLIGGVAANIALFWGVFSGQLASISSGAATSSQQIIGLLLSLYAWLSAVWLLRAVLAKRKPRLRDGLYSSGGPVIAILLLTLVFVIQLLPAAVALIIYGAADSSGLLDQTAILMLFGGGAALLSVLSVYWATSTAIAMVIITLPGMYPMQALRLAGDLVVGRRLRILLRLIWAAVLVLLLWLVILMPVIIIDGALKSAIPALEWLPAVPVTALLLASFSVVFMSSYIYIFYRKVVEDDSAPA